MTSIRLPGTSVFFVQPARASLVGAVSHPDHCSTAPSVVLASKKTKTWGLANCRLGHRADKSLGLRLIEGSAAVMSENLSRTCQGRQGQRQNESSCCHELVSSEAAFTASSDCDVILLRPPCRA